MPGSHSRTATGARRRARLRMRACATGAVLGGALIAVVAASGPALALTAGAAATKPARAPASAKTTYTGKTAQGLAVRLSKPFSFGRSFTYDATMKCSDGSTFTDNPFLDDVRIKSGRFKSHVSADRGATLTDIKGTIKGKRASGTINVTERYSATVNAQGNFPLDPKGSVVCRSGVVKWSAKAQAASKRAPKKAAHKPRAK
jgi:hypothetical protein